MANRFYEEGARRWFEKADGDLRMAEAGLRLDPPELDGAAFHSQQAAEKCLKGFLAYHGEDPPRTHDLIRLVNLSRIHDQRLSRLQDHAKYLSSFAVNTRYPFTGARLTEEEAASALEQARQIRGTVLVHLDL